ncbi:uncharacterized protein LOC115151819 isoform X2 [Salmo trutta]|nr:uncharacterized protein LOC115151819 isoform X2 [Salmo trutta]
MVVSTDSEQEPSVFVRESYKRMKLWEETSEDRRHRRLDVIGETRCWAKDEALRKVFGSFAKPDRTLYTDVVITMERIEKDVTIKPDIRSKAQGYKDALLKYETILTAEVFLRIFEQMSPLSKYLQTSGMDIVTAQHLVTGTEDNLRKCAQDFEGVKRAADDFVEWANGILEEQQDCDAEAQTALPEKRTKKKEENQVSWQKTSPLLMQTWITKSRSTMWYWTLLLKVFTAVMQQMQCCVQMSPA